MNDNIFSILNWVLKKPKIELKIEEKLSTFLLNRWLSMVGTDHANIVNETTNRWYYVNSIYSDINCVSKLYRTIIPKNTKKINYIKKNKEKKEKTKNQDCFEHTQREISKRELQEQKRLIEELTNITK